MTNIGDYTSLTRTFRLSSSDFIAAWLEGICQK